MRDYHLPGRSTVYGTNGMAATSMPQSTLAAIEMLKAGGNAMDAAVTAAAVQAVVEPQSTGIGGDCFCLYVPAGSKQVIALNGSGRSPAGLTLDALASRGVTKLEETSPHVVTIPGAISAWDKLLGAYGTKGLDSVLRPAIRYAEDGYVVHPKVAWDWDLNLPKLRKTEAADLLPGGTAPKAGSVMRLPALGRTLRAIAAKGASAFYEGEIAASMVRTLRDLGGTHALEDFAAGLGAAEFVEPITTKFAGYDVWECPPNGSGLIALMIMGIMDGIAPTEDPLDPLRMHRHIEAARLAYRDRDAFLADPAFMRVSTDTLLDPAYLAGLRRLIDDTRAMTGLPPAGTAHPHTIYLSVVDRDGNACSFINSLFENFGSGILDAGSGVLLQNRGLGLRMEPDHPSAVGPNKRPLHTIMPAMVTKDGEAAISFGVMGGHFQPMGQSWVLSNLLQYGLDPQESIDLARLLPYGGKVEIERGIPMAARSALEALGHTLGITHRPHGGGQMIVIDREAGVLKGASDPRKDGCALGY